jgi:Uncharacterised protein family (UPF0236)
MSPYLQELLVFAGATDVYAAVPEIFTRFLRVQVSPSAVYRVTMAVAAALPETALLAPVATGATYAQVDGSMVRLDGGWQEVKVCRVYPRDAQTGAPDLTQSRYCAHLGTHTDFTAKVEALLPAAPTHPLVFLSDGARWIDQWIQKKYPKAVCILDFYHAAEHLALAVKDVNLPPQWLDKQCENLKKSQVKSVLKALAKLPDLDEERRAALCKYYQNNAHRMNYAHYQACGYDIGTGAIEAAHKTLIQVRMKRSGQQWSPQKAPLMLKLRVAYKSQLWKTVENTLN